jgi:hypothetical protein
VLSKFRHLSDGIRLYHSRMAKKKKKHLPIPLKDDKFCNQPYSSTKTPQIYGFKVVGSPKRSHYRTPKQRIFCACVQISETSYLHHLTFIFTFSYNIKVTQCNETNVMHFLFNLLKIKSLYIFRTLLAHLQEVLHKRHLVYWVRVMSVGCYQNCLRRQFHFNPGSSQLT